MRAHITTVPLNIVEDILFEACSTLPYSPPFPPGALARTCRALRSLVEPCMDSLLARLHTHHCDIPRAIANDAKLETSRLAAELRTRTVAFNHISSGRLFASDFDPDLRFNVLSTLYLTMLEDAGCNARFIYESGLVKGLMDFICRHPLHASEDSKSWPMANSSNAVLLALLAGLERKVDIELETPELRQTLLAKIRPLALAQFRYPISLSAAPVFDPPTEMPPVVTVVHYGRVVPLTLPPVAMSAAQILFAHWDAFPPQVPYGLLPTRAAAIAAYGPANIGPTQADLHEIRDRMGDRFSSLGLGTPKVWESDWRRATAHPSAAGEPTSVYKLGSLSGHWTGSCFYPCSIAYDAMREADVPPDRDIIIHSPPAFVHFREYVRRRGAPPLESPSPKDGWKHAWLPRNFFASQKEVAADDAPADWKTFYTEFDSTSSVDAGELWDPAQHVVIVGKTEERHAMAWGTFEWTGTVRRSDGQVVLLRHSHIPHDTKLVVGYLTADRQLVGHIMDVLEGYAPADFAAPFSLTRVAK